MASGKISQKLKKEKSERQCANTSSIIDVTFKQNILEADNSSARPINKDPGPNLEQHSNTPRQQNG